MRPDPVVEFCLGLGAIVAAIAVALLLAFPPAWMDHRQGAVVTLNNVSHLAEGSNVSENGFVWGTVTKIEAVKNYFRVHMKLQPKFELKPNHALALEDTNPLQAASLLVVQQCKLTAGEPVPAGCCPDKINASGSETNEQGLASCGHLPNLLDQAQAIGVVAKNQIGAVGKTIDELKKNLDPLMAKASVTLDNSQVTLKSALATSDKARVALSDQNIANLTKVLDSTQATMDRVKTTSASIDEVVQKEKEELKTSISSVSSTLVTTAANLPDIMSNLQKSLDDLRVLTGQLRSEPTSLVRKRERTDPSFVDPAPEK